MSTDVANALYALAAADKASSAQLPCSQYTEVDTSKLAALLCRARSW